VNGPAASFGPAEALGAALARHVVTSSDGKLQAAAYWASTRPVTSRPAGESCPIYALATGPLRPGESTLVVAYEKSRVLALALTPCTPGLTASTFSIAAIG
jgi:hypothetical protein